MFVDDPFFTRGGYSDVCHNTTEEVRESAFCRCVHVYRDQYEKDVSEKFQLEIGIPD